MSEKRTSPHNNENDESGLLLSVDPTSDRSPDSAPLSDDTDATDAGGEDIVADSDETDASDTDTDGTDDADGQD